MEAQNNSTPGTAIPEAEETHNHDGGDSGTTAAKTTNEPTRQFAVSFFDGINPIPINTLSLQQVADLIRGPTMKEQTETIRRVCAAEGKDAIRELKKKLPAVAMTGIFSQRGNDYWMESSGLVNVDLDGLDPSRLASVVYELRSFPWVVPVFVSPSGKGVKAAVYVPGLNIPNKTNYEIAWRAVTRWLASLGLENDNNIKDRGRLCFLCCDPDMYLNPCPAPFPLDLWAEHETPQAPPAIAALQRNDSPVARGNRPDSLERGRLWLEKAPGGVQGDGGSATYAAAVALVHGLEIPEGDAVDLLERYHSPKCGGKTPWTRSELIHKCRDAATKPHDKPRGYLLNADRSIVHAQDVVPPIWPPLLPLDKNDAPPAFDPSVMFPADLPELAEYVVSASEALQVPTELTAAITLGLGALACSRSVEVVVDPVTGWIEPAQVWMIPLLLPGERKSASMSSHKKPFIEWRKAESERLRGALARYAEKRKSTEKRLESLRAKQAKADVPDSSLAQEAMDLAVELEGMPERLCSPDILMQSFTPEGLRDRLEENGEKVGIVSAEIDGAEIMGARYTSAGPNIDLMLSAHAGESASCCRAGGRKIDLEAPAVTLVLSVQPEALRPVLADRVAGGRGLLDRMLLIRPPSRMGKRLLDAPGIPAHLQEWWASRVRSILDLPWPGRVTLGPDGAQKCALPTRQLLLSSEARIHLWALRSDIETRLRVDADLRPLSGFASKLPGAIARIALVLAVLRDPMATEVTEESMMAAVTWAPLLIAHRRIVLQESSESPELHQAKRLVRWLSRRGQAVMSERDLFRAIEDSAVPDMQSFEPIITLLADREMIRLFPTPENHPGKPGRPARRYAIHPDLLPKP